MYKLNKVPSHPPVGIHAAMKDADDFKRGGRLHRIKDMGLKAGAQQAWPDMPGIAP